MNRTKALLLVVIALLFGILVYSMKTNQVLIQNSNAEMTQQAELIATNAQLSTKVAQYEGQDPTFVPATFTEVVSTPQPIITRTILVTEKPTLYSSYIYSFTSSPAEYGSFFIMWKLQIDPQGLPQDAAWGQMHEAFKLVKNSCPYSGYETNNFGLSYMAINRDSYSTIPMTAGCWSILEAVTGNTLQQSDPTFGHDREIDCHFGVACQILTAQEIITAQKSLVADNTNLLVDPNGQAYSTIREYNRNEPNFYGWTGIGERFLYPSTVKFEESGSAPLMGITNWDSKQLCYRSAGHVGFGEIPQFVPGGETRCLDPKVDFKNLTADDRPFWNLVSQGYADNGRLVFTWIWIPELKDGKLVIHVLDIDVTRLIPAAMPTNIGTKFDVPYTAYPAKAYSWGNGDLVKLVAVTWSYQNSTATDTQWRGLIHQFESITLELDDKTQVTLTSGFNAKLPNGVEEFSYVPVNFIGRSAVVDLSEFEADERVIFDFRM